MNIVEMLIVAAATEYYLRRWIVTEKKNGKGRTYRTARRVALSALLPQ